MEIIAIPTVDPWETLVSSPSVRTFSETDDPITAGSGKSVLRFVGLSYFHLELSDIIRKLRYHPRLEWDEKAWLMFSRFLFL
jgi:hypothetical protein